MALKLADKATIGMVVSTLLLAAIQGVSAALEAKFRCNTRVCAGTASQIPIETEQRQSNSTVVIPRLAKAVPAIVVGRELRR